MAEVVPSIQVTDVQGPDVSNGDDKGSPVPPTSPSEFSNDTGVQEGRRKAAAANEAKSGRADNRSSSGQTIIDPLSQHILKRTHAENIIPQKLRTGATDGAAQEPRPAGGPLDVLSEGQPLEPLSGENGTLKGKNRKGVSFLSRFMSGKKKAVVEDGNDDESEAGDVRNEGVNANVFSQPIQSSYGYTPHHLNPPEYIKVRSHNKKEREFNRVFLAQELQAQPQAKTRSFSQGSAFGQPTPTKGAIWALEFSKDGRHLAAAGQDKIVRVWAVISTPGERQAHEHEEDATSTGDDSQGFRLNAPVFKAKTLQEYTGHTADVLDLSWSKNNFLLSSSMDKTVRLWHVSRGECLCCFKHSDFVTSISFHPRDDRFFLAGSLDSKLRLWSIPDKSVAFWNQLPDLVTAVAFTPDGKTAIAGCLNGLCLFYETEGLKYHTQIHVRSTHGRNAKGSKVTGIQSMTYPPQDVNGEVKLLITSNDSRIRLYNFRDKSLEMKFKGNENTCSQIRATFSDNAQYVICGSEDRKVYIWGTGPAEGEKKDKRPVETFAAHSAIVTTAILAPTRTRQLLGGSGDPLYDLCNPPPVNLAGAIESHASKAATENGLRESDPSAPPTPATVETQNRALLKVEESPNYLARSTHTDGNIIVTADYMGQIKVFRQDCAYQKRRNESWETSSNFSKRLSSGIIPRSGTRNSSTSGRRNSASTRPPSDRILSWRNSVSNTSIDGSFKQGTTTRSISPRKSLRGGSSMAQHASTSTPMTNNTTPSMSTTSQPPSPRRQSAEIAKTSADSRLGVRSSNSNPLMIQEGGQSMVFWNLQSWSAQKSGPSGDASSGDPSFLGPLATRKASRVSRLSSEESSAGDLSSGNGSDSDHVRCKQCGGASFRATIGKGGVLGLGGGKGRKLVCKKCGTVA